MSLSDWIMEIPKGLTCACGECDLSNIRTKNVKEFIKKANKIIDDEFLEVEKVSNAKIAQSFYIFKQQIKRKIKKEAGPKLI